ncbi:MAG: hypothetical protein ACRCX8_19415 [Sarcina sp.]
MINSVIELAEFYKYAGTIDASDKEMKTQQFKREVNFLKEISKEITSTWTLQHEMNVYTLNIFLPFLQSPITIEIQEEDAIKIREKLKIPIQGLYDEEVLGICDGDIPF